MKQGEKKYFNFLRGRVLSLCFIFVLFLTLVPYITYSQWKLVAPNQIAPFPPDPTDRKTGAIHFKDGILWAGWQDIWKSLDSGMTWEKINFDLTNDEIVDIQFYDKLNGLIATTEQGLFQTRDGGQSWNLILPAIPNSARGYVVCTAFGELPNIIYAYEARAVFQVSTDGGGTWQGFKLSDDLGNSFTIAKDHTIFAFTTSFGWVSTIWSLNKQGSPGQSKTNYFQDEPGGDCFSMSVDSCDLNMLYIANENYLKPGDGNSRLFYSNDQGTSWTSALKNPRKFLTGYITSSLHAQYASSLTDGIFRSTDNGSNWKNIGGPAGIPFDSRNIACVNDNIVFVMDDQGSIWRTDNSGGDSLFFTAPSIQIRKSNLHASVKVSDSAPVDIIYKSGSPNQKFDSVSFILHYCGPLIFLHDSVGKGWIEKQRKLTDTTVLFILELIDTSQLDSFILRAYFQAAVGKETSAAIALDEVNFNQDVTFRDCMISSLSKTDSFFVDVTDQCGDSTLRNFLVNGTMPLRIISIHPNPAQEEVHIDVNSPISQNAILEVYNALGERVYSEPKNILVGTSSIRLDERALPAGVYSIRIGNAMQSFVKLQ